MTRFTNAELEAFLDEGLTAARMAEIEQAARGDAALVARLRGIHDRRDAGVHSLGEIWRRHRLSCPTRQQLGSFLLGILEPEHAAYVQFHLTSIQCRVCQANLADLQNQQAQAAESVSVRRRKYFQSSAGLLQKR